MTDPMLVRRLALDLRNLADKTLELRGVVEDYRHDLVRTIEDDWCDPDELQAMHRQVQELWESMDRAEAKLRSGSPPHVAAPLARVALSSGPRLPTEGPMIIVTRLHGASVAVNCDLIERVEATPETVVTLVDGSRYVVKESVSEIVDKIRAFRASVVLLAGRLEGTAARPASSALPRAEPRPGQPRRSGAPRSGPGGPPAAPGRGRRRRRWPGRRAGRRPWPGRARPPASRGRAA